MNRRAFFAAGGALALAGGGLAATSFADGPDTPNKPDAKLAVLDRPATETAGNPYATPLGRTLAAQRGDTIDAASARGVTTNGATVWIAETSKNSVCSSSQIGKAGAVGISCADASDFNRNGLFSETADVEGSLTSIGVVPDSITSVKLNQPDGSTTSTAVKGNVVVSSVAQRPESAVLINAQGEAQTVTFGAKR